MATFSGAMVRPCCRIKAIAHSVTSVPAHLRDAHYGGAEELGHGVGYRYPHDDPAGWVPQRYLPDELGDRAYYEPSQHGREAAVLRWRVAGSGDGEEPPAPR